GLLDLTWDDTSQLKLSDSWRAWVHGAVWKVEYYNKTINKGTFTGEVNAAIDAASTLIKKYYELLARRMYTEAYELFDDKQNTQTIIKNLWPNNRTSTASGVEIKIVSHDEAKVILHVDTERLIKNDYKSCLDNIDPCYYQHTVINRGGSWYIDD